MRNNNHTRLHQETGEYEKSLLISLNAVLKDNYKYIESIVSLLAYIRMKAKEIILDSDEILLALEKRDIAEILDTLFMIKSNIDFFTEEAIKLKRPLVALINEIEEHHKEPKGTT